MPRDPQADAVALSVDTQAEADVVVDADGTVQRAAGGSLQVHIADGSPRPADADLVVELTDDPAAADMRLRLLGYAAPAEGGGEGGGGEPSGGTVETILAVDLNAAVVTYLEGAGYTVTTRTEAASEVTEGYDLVIVGTGSANVVGKYQGENLPVLHLADGSIIDQGFADSSSNDVSETQLTYMSGAAIPWAGNTEEDDITVSGTAATIKYSTYTSLPIGAVPFVNRVGDSDHDHRVGWLIPTGVTLLDGSATVTSHPVVVIGAPDTWLGDLTANGEAMLDAVIQMFASYSDALPEFDIESDITWDALYYAEGTAFAALAIADGGTLTDGTGWPNETAEADASAVVDTITYRDAATLLNGQPALEFDGSSYCDTNGGWSGGAMSGVVSIATVVCLNALSHERICGSHDNDSYCKLWRHGTAGDWYMAAGSDTNTGYKADTAPHLLVAVYNPSGNDKLYLDGQLIFDGSAGTGGEALDGIIIGTYQNSTSSAMSGQMGFLGVYGGDLSAHASWADFVAWAVQKYVPGGVPS